MYPKSVSRELTTSIHHLYLLTLFDCFVARLFCSVLLRFEFSLPEVIKNDSAVSFVQTNGRKSDFFIQIYKAIHTRGIHCYVSFCDRVIGVIGKLVANSEILGYGLEVDHKWFLNIFLVRLYPLALMLSCLLCPGKHALQMRMKYLRRSQQL